MHTHFSRRSALNGVASAALMVAMGMAQSAWAEGPAGGAVTAVAAADEDAGRLSEVIVTAERQATNLQDTPVSISVVTAQSPR